MSKRVYNFGERLALYNDLPINVSDLVNDAQYTTSQEVQNLIDASTIQYSIMPEPSSENEGIIVQYIGTTNEYYTNGYFYKCISDEQQEPTYSWEQMNIQPAPNNVETTTNKVTTITPNATDTQYPSAKAVYDLTQPYYITNGPQQGFNFSTAAAGTYIITPANNANKQFYFVTQPNGTTYTREGTCLYIVINKKYSDASLQEKIGYLYLYDYDGKMARVVLSKDNGYVKLTYQYGLYNDTFITDQAQTFTGIKTFNSFPVTPSSAPSTDYQVANKKYIDDLIGNLDITDREIVQTLPTQDISTKTIYMVPKSTAGSQNTYTEYMYINNAWEKIGDTEVDLSDYVTTSDLSTAVAGVETQYSTMPIASSETVGKIIQYIGTTTAEAPIYTNGYFYIGTTDGEQTPTYN